MQVKSINSIESNDLSFNKIQESSTASGMSPIPVGTNILDAALKFENFLMSQLLNQFDNLYKISLEGKTDNGYLIGLETSQIKKSPPDFFVTQIANDLKNWNLPCNQEIANNIAANIINHALIQAGVKNFLHGCIVTEEEKFAWMAGYGIVAVTNSNLGIVYVFGAALLSAKNSWNGLTIDDMQHALSNTSFCLLSIICVINNQSDFQLSKIYEDRKYGVFKVSPPSILLPGSSQGFCTYNSLGGGPAGWVIYSFDQNYNIIIYWQNYMTDTNQGWIYFISKSIELTRENIEKYSQNENLISTQGGFICNSQINSGFKNAIFTYSIYKT